MHVFQNKGTFSSIFNPILSHFCVILDYQTAPITEWQYGLFSYIEIGSRTSCLWSHLEFTDRALKLRKYQIKKVHTLVTMGQFNFEQNLKLIIVEKVEIH